MPEVLLKDLALARSGDKGNTVNIALLAPDAKHYEWFKEQVTEEKVKAHFKGLVKGEVIRYEVPNIYALNFILKDALGGGGSASMRVDNLGKCFSSNLLRMTINKVKGK